MLPLALSCTIYHYFLTTGLNHKGNSTDELLMIKLVKVPQQDRFINKRFVSEETVVPCQCESKTIKFGIKQVEWMKE